MDSVTVQKGKTMSDYIKREDAVRRIAVLIAAEAESDGCEDQPMENYIEYASEDLADIPSADVAPVRHGRWKHERLPSTSGGSYAVVRCSACEYQYPMAETRYCPNCGARMDEGVKE